jgi:hypothetical protein
MSHATFANAQSVLNAPAREKLALGSGILSSHPTLPHVTERPHHSDSTDTPSQPRESAMYAYITRERCRPLAIRLSALTALVALGACADAPPATAPVAPSRPHFGIGPIITVTNTSGGTGTGSLRWAARQATVYSVILFEPSLAGATITLDSTLRVGPDVTIEGPQTKGITISGGGTMGVLDLARGAAVRNLTITAGKACVGGGIVAWNGHVTVEHSTVTGNRAECYDALGGGFMPIR